MEAVNFTISLVSFAPHVVLFQDYYCTLHSNLQFTHERPAHMAFRVYDLHLF